MGKDDENDRITVLAKRAGRALGYVVAVYLLFSIGQQLKFW